jgi:acyl-CoA synthetase (NDP forming)/GNAT superfamily N-acetyltransferase
MSDGPGGPPAAVTYPAHWEADVVLRDGGTVHVRPITPEDAPAVERFHAGQSEESIYLRFFAVLPRLSEQDLYRFTHVDHVGRVAFVATLGEVIVGIGRYDTTGPGAAEVAFNISDAHQGRGLGTVLLEHLAAAARERGLRVFEAIVLPQNRKMLTVFREAGYEVRSEYDDGVVTLRFDIDPTERSLAVMEAREHRAEARSVQRLLNPASVAVIGASRRTGTVGHHLLADVLAAGFTGRIDVVHPEADEVLGTPAVPGIGAIGEPVDVAVVAVPAAAVLDVVAECAQAGVRGLVVLSGGFAESGPEGARRQADLVRLARANGMRVIGPNSFGMINADPAVRLNASLVSRMPAPGRFGLFSQSGALSVAVLDAAAERGLGVSTFLSAGNRADISSNDCLQYWESDAGTDVIGLYLESIGNARKFSRIARRMARSKPVIVLKSGSSGFGRPDGRPSPSGHDPAQVLDQMLRQSGCIRVETIRQLLDVAQMVLHQPLPAGPRVALVSNSDALGSLIVDACRAWDLAVVHGPAWIGPQAGPEEFRDALRDALAAPGAESVIAAFAPPVTTDLEDVAHVVADCADGARVPVLACFPGVGEVREILRRVPTYPTPEEAVQVLAAATRYGAWRLRDPGTRVEITPREVDEARRLVNEWLGDRSGEVILDRDRCTELLACYGIRLWPLVPARDVDDATAAAERLGWPVVLRTTAPHLRHRLDLGGVQLDVTDADGLRAAWDQLRQRLQSLGGADLAVQRMAPRGVACVLRSAEDPVFGPVVSFGLAGDATELLGDLAYRVPPLTDVDVADLIRSVRAAPRLFGRHGGQPMDVHALEDVAGRVSCLADDLPEVAALELQPVLVARTGAAVLDAGIRLSPATGRHDATRRELSPAG